MFDYKVITQKELITTRRIIAEEIVEIAKNDPTLHEAVVAVDEAFMIKGVANALIRVFKAGITVVVYSLDL